MEGNLHCKGEKHTIWVSSVSTGVHFLLQDLVQCTPVTPAVTSESPLTCESFSVLSCVSWSCYFWGILVRHFVDSLLTRISLIFSHNCTKIINLCDEQHHRNDGPFSSYPTSGYIIATWLVRSDATVITWLRWCHLDFSNVKLLFPSLHVLFLRSKSLSPACT